MHKILFFGTSEFAIPSLEALARDDRFEVAAVVTQPDRPFGRHAEVTPPPVKDAVGWIPTFVGMTEGARTTKRPEIRQPEKIKDADFTGWIREIGPSCDAFVVVSYGKILPQWLLDLPKRGVVNVHGSLLSRWRGASPIQAAIAAGDAVSGVTVMQLDALMDHGPIIAIAEEPIRDTDTGGSLHDRLAEIGGNMLPDVLNGYIDGTVTPVEQDHDKATSCTVLKRENGKIDWNKDANDIARLVRAYNPWPGTWTEWNGKRLKIHAAHVGADASGKKPGEHFIQDGLPRISAGGGTTLELVTLQPEGKPAMDAATFLRGNDWV